MSQDQDPIQDVDVTASATDKVELFRTKIKAVAVCAQVGVPFLLKGPPGNTKTSIAEAIFRQVCVTYVTSIAALNDPAYYAGYPSKGNKRIPDGSGEGSHEVEVAMMLPNEWAVELSQQARANPGQRVGLFFDELGSAAPATRAACLRGILQGHWGEHTIPNSSPGAAINPTDMAEGGYEFSAALANRFAHFEWDPPEQWWDEQDMLGFPDPEVPKLPADWRKHIHQAKVLKSAFCRRRPALMQACPDQAELRSKSWPSYRTWTWTCEVLAACFSLGAGPNSDLAMILVSSLIGPGPAREFLTYCQELDLPDPEALLKDPSSLRLPRRGDRAYAVLTNVVAAVLANNTPARWNAAWEVLGQAVEIGRPDVGATSARMLAAKKPDKGVRTPQAVGKFVPLLKRAGMLGAK
jgi:hypothetical protein